MLEAHAPVLVDKIPPRGPTDPFRDLRRIAPLVFPDLTLEQHGLDAQVFFAGGDFHVYPGVALDQCDLLIDLLVEPGQDRLAGWRQDLDQGCLILDAGGQTFRQGDIQPQAVGDLLPGFLIELLPGLALVHHLFENPPGHVGFAAKGRCEGRIGRTLAGKRFVDQGLNGVENALGEGVFALAQPAQGLRGQRPDLSFAG